MCASHRDEHSTTWLSIRTGIHTGECDLKGGSLTGMAVHIAARVQAHANPGGNPGFKCGQRSRAWTWNSVRRPRCFYFEGSARRMASLRDFRVTLRADTDRPVNPCRKCVAFWPITTCRPDT